MAGEVSEVGKGFFNEAGKLKSPEQLAKETEAQSKSKAKETEVIETSVDITSDTKSAFRAVRNNFNQQVKEVTTQLDENEQFIEEADKIVKEQLDTARDLKEALRTEDNEKASEARSRLKELDIQRRALSQEIDDKNRERAPERVQSLSLGNSQRGQVKVEEVKLKPKIESDFGTTEDVNKFIDGLKTDKASLNDQRVKLQEVQGEVKTIVKDTRAELTQIEGDTIRSIDEAKATADKVATEIKSRGSDFALSTISTKINETVVKNLFN